MIIMLSSGAILT
jgi:hypothetical protein